MRSESSRPWYIDSADFAPRKPTILDLMCRMQVPRNMLQMDYLETPPGTTAYLYNGQHMSLRPRLHCHRTDALPPLKQASYCRNLAMWQQVDTRRVDVLCGFQGRLGLNPKGDAQVWSNLHVWTSEGCHTPASSIGHKTLRIDIDESVEETTQWPQGSQQPRAVSLTEFVVVTSQPPKLFVAMFSCI